jgi:flavodoxin
MSKILVAYFSCSGETAKLAKTLAGVVKGELFRIEPAVPYTEADLDWHNSRSRSTVEMQDKKSRPALKDGGKVKGLEQYDTVFVGFPIWWGVAPAVINTFLEANNFSGKTLIPFATSGGSGAGTVDNQLPALCSKDTKWKPAKRFPSDTGAAALQSWVKELGL